MSRIDRSLFDLGATLENTFFGIDRRRLLAQLKGTAGAGATREALAAASGIHDVAVLDRLLELGVHGDTFAALTLAPLVAVAWADGQVDDRERDAVLDAAEASGLRRGEPSYMLLGRHLLEQPHPRLLETWQEFIGILLSSLDDEGRRLLSAEILARARRIAEASRGGLGLGRRVSRSEQRILDQLERALRS